MVSAADHLEVPRRRHARCLVGSPVVDVDEQHLHGVNAQFGSVGPPETTWALSAQRCATLDSRLGTADTDKEGS